MWERVSLVDGHSVGDTVTRVHDYASGASRGVEGQHCLDVDIYGGTVERLEHDLRHLLPVGLGVQGGLGQQHWVLLRGHSQLVVESVVPDLLHVVPVTNQTSFNSQEILISKVRFQEQNRHFNAFSFEFCSLSKLI